MSHRHLILGLLAEHPMTGYDIKKHVSATLGTVTNASYGTLYPTLHKLRDDDAVEVQEIPQAGRPSKKVYKITIKGKEELMQWLQQPTAADQVKREFLLKLYFANNLPAEHLKIMISERQKAVETLQETSRAERNLLNNPWQVRIVDYTLAMCKAELEWLKQLELEIGVA